MTPILDEDQMLYLEADYRSGALTLQQLATTYGISVATITNYASHFNWERDLKARVRERAKEKVAESLAAQELAELRSGKVDTEQAIEVAATIQKNVILQSQKRLQRLQKHLDGMIGEFEAQAMSPQDIEDVAVLVAMTQGQMNEVESSPAVVERRVASFKKLLSLGDRLGSFKTIADITKTLMGIERQAFGIQDGAEAGDDPNPIPVLQSMNDAARRVAFMLTASARRQQEKVINDDRNPPSS